VAVFLQIINVELLIMQLLHTLLSSLVFVMIVSSDIKRGQKVKAKTLRPREARTTRPRPSLQGWGRPHV